MKKLLSLVLIAATATIYSCGPSAEEQKAAEQHTKDSLDKIAADSTEAANAQAAAMAAEQHAKDSMANAAAEQHAKDSIEAASKKKPAAKTPAMKKADDVKKTVKGRG